jgi:hypothetical protein
MKTQLTKPARSKARYTEEYKKEALELWRASGRSATDSSNTIQLRFDCRQKIESHNIKCLDLTPHSDPVKFGVSDYAASKAFFLKALEPLGVSVLSEGPPTYGRRA